MFIRYNPVLKSVITFTEDLAYKQAKEADDLLEQGKYLGMYCLVLILFLSFVGTIFGYMLLPVTIDAHLDMIQVSFIVQYTLKASFCHANVIISLRSCGTKC